MRALLRLTRLLLLASPAVVLCFLLSSCESRGGKPLVIVDSMYATAHSLEDVSRIAIEGSGRVEVEILRDPANPVPELERILERGYSRVLVSPFLADAAESVASEYPGTFFGLMRYRTTESGISEDNTVDLILDRSGAVVDLAERIVVEAASAAPPGDDGAAHILGLWRTVSETGRSELELFRRALAEGSPGGLSVEIREVGDRPDLEELEIFIREGITANTVIGLCFAGPADVACARIFWEYGIPIAAEGLAGTGSVWGPVAYTVFHGIDTVFQSFRAINPEESPSSIVIEASLASSEGQNS
ncbi:MAG: hypothetical protein ACLFRY_06280 [Spirochaetia bacterium]